MSPERHPDVRVTPGDSVAIVLGPGGVQWHGPRWAVVPGWGRGSNVLPVSATFPFQGHVRTGEILHHIPLLLAGRTGNIAERAPHTAAGALERTEEKVVEPYT